MLDLRKIATKAGLDTAESNHFAEGLVRSAGEPLELSREKFTNLQTGFEERVMDAIEVNPQKAYDESYQRESAPFMYRTPKLVTPIHNKSHPRAAVVERMACPKDWDLALANFVCSHEGLKEMENLEHLRSQGGRERLLRILNPKGLLFDPFSVDAQGVDSPSSFMAMRSLRGVGPIKFDASQMPDLKNDSPGKVVFGREALAAYNEAREQHVINLLQGRKSALIKAVLLGE